MIFSLPPTEHPWAPRNGLVGWWPLRGDYRDYSGTGAHGTAQGNASLTTGKFGGAVTLDGNGDYVDCTNAAALNLAAGGIMTVSCWVKLAALPSASSYFDVIGRGQGGWELYVYNTAGVYTLRFSTVSSSSNAGIATFASLSTGVWYFLAGVHVGGKSYAYINGAVGATVGTEGFNSTTNSNKIGYNYQYTNGDICDVRIYNTDQRAVLAEMYQRSK
jgi:hypothetical protein